MEVATSRRPIEMPHQSPGFFKRRTFNQMKKRSHSADTDDSFSSHTLETRLSNSSSSHDRSATECLIELRDYFSSPSSPSVSDAEIFRFACYHNFQYSEALTDILQKHDSRHMNLRMSGFLMKQLQTKTLFPLPGLKTKNKKCDVFYMRPSRYVPSQMKTTMVIDNLCYVLNDLSQTKDQCQNGVAFIANMNDWTMKNFSHDYCFQFMQALQGKMVPTKVELFLIVNPPSWFGRVWKVMKSMLSKSFAKKVHMIKEDRLGEFLMDGYDQYVPDEFSAGWKITEEITDDYIDFRQYEDSQKDTGLRLIHPRG
ncbi:unnamed protein product [Cylindrotheca closterium]|uniref:CRAL-TRIO domain-containing protein n=1 Tax=Cylindrotheca closterium TaxID=2856 RepID=A0AAD2PXT0_9STRA|nr:unnamed protein product [Cylindrotheca closterium]